MLRLDFQLDFCPGAMSGFRKSIGFVLKICTTSASFPFISTSSGTPAVIYLFMHAFLYILTVNDFLGHDGIKDH